MALSADFFALAMIVTRVSGAPGKPKYSVFQRSEGFVRTFENKHYASFLTLSLQVAIIEDIRWE